MFNKKMDTLILAEINKAEKRLAKTLMEKLAFKEWVKTLRQTYVVKGFLMPLYITDGKYSIPKHRVSLGDYILPWDREGEMLNQAPKVWIKAEKTWFWWYLNEGQELVPWQYPIPDIYQIQGIPATRVWEDVMTFTHRHKLFGEPGGGILIEPIDLEETYLARNVQKTNREEGEDGYQESYKLPATPFWINKFLAYDQDYAASQLEVRPPWFHMIKYAFFNESIERLPIFSGIFTEKRKLSNIRFLDPNLSNKLREQIGTMLFSMPKYIQKQTEAFSMKKEMREMTWWLWHNVGNPKTKKPLSYGEIAIISKVPRPSVQEAVNRFDQKFKKEINGLLLGQMLRVAHAIGLGENKTYRILAEKCWVPYRERDIDGFDDIDKLI